MKKFIYVLAIMLMSSSANAAIRSIVDWDGGANPYQPGDVSVTGESLKTKCSEACPGYDLKTTTCARSDHKIIHCQVPGCGYYNKCLALSDEELKNNKYDPLDDIDVDAVYNQIMEEQRAQQEQLNAIQEIQNNM